MHLAGCLGADQLTISAAYACSITSSLQFYKDEGIKDTGKYIIDASLLRHWDVVFLPVDPLDFKCNTCFYYV